MISSQECLFSYEEIHISDHSNFLIIVSLAALSKLCQLSKPREVTADSDALPLDSRRKRS